jgi:nucleotide-binding universal stress UspA family protein
MSEQVVVGVDGSPASYTALRWALAHAGRVAVRQKVVRGLAGSGLVTQAAGADLLVVGHGPRSIEMLHRSVSWYCMRHATCPVLVIPPAMATRRTLTPATARVSA